MKKSKTPNRLFKDAIYREFSRIGKAISSPKRLEILELLDQGERRVEVLAREAGMTIANTSQHLQILRDAHLVEAEKNGLFVIYRLTDEAVSKFFLSLRGLAEKQLSEIKEISRRFLAGRESLEPVNRETLRKRVRQGRVIVLDVRPIEEYRAGHIPGAISIPLKELENRLAKLPKNQEIVAYCRGPYCVLAVDATAILRAKGYRAVRMKDGIPDWRAHGLPVAVGDTPK